MLCVLGLLNRKIRKSDTVGLGGAVLALVPAHNEARVIGATVRYLRLAGCEVVVVADACTDDTGLIAALEGAFVYPVDAHNKARALNAFLDASALPGAFYSLAVVDCGTLVGPSFAGRLREGLTRAPFVQGWLLSAGPRTWVNSWYSWLYGVQHAMALGRDLLGLPAWIGGSGFGWRSTEHVRFDSRCLVEDLELSFSVHASGRQVVYCDLDVADEKPSGLRQSLIQRLRWARGGWWLVFHGRWLTWRFDDVTVGLNTFASLVFGYFFVQTFVYAPAYLMGSVFVYGVVGLAGLARLDQLGRVRPSLLFAIPFMTVCEAFITLWGLLTWRNVSWTRTAHTVTGRDAANGRREPDIDATATEGLTSKT